MKRITLKVPTLILLTLACNLGKSTATPPTGVAEPLRRNSFVFLA